MPLITRTDAKNVFGSTEDIAIKLNCTVMAIYQWPDDVAPRGRAAELCAHSDGKLVFDAAAYDEYDAQKNPDKKRRRDSRMVQQVDEADELVTGAEALVAEVTKKVTEARKKVTAAKAKTQYTLDRTQ